MTETPIEAPALERSPAQTAATVLSVTSSDEPHRERLARHARRARLYAVAGTFVALLAVLVVLASKNTQTAKLDWVAGSTRASLAWIILAATVFGWLLGITTALTVHRRTRRAH
jgi:uncharacterized integral membrane protein